MAVGAEGGAEDENCDREHLEKEEGEKRKETLSESEREREREPFRISERP